MPRQASGKWITAPEPLLAEAEQICAQLIGGKSGVLHEQAQSVAGAARLLFQLQNHFERWCASDRSSGCRGLCMEHARQMARAYVFSLHWLGLDARHLIRRIQWPEFAWIGTVTGYSRWLLTATSLLIGGQARDWWGGASTRGCVRVLRTFPRSIRFLADAIEPPLWTPAVSANDAARIFTVLGVRPTRSLADYRADEFATSLDHHFARTRWSRGLAVALVSRIVQTGS